jgi:di-N-acetylchitobiase
MGSSIRDDDDSVEIYGFAGRNSTGEFYNWTHITTVAWASSDALMCRAHQNGARAILAAPSFNLTEIVAERKKNASEMYYISEWVASTIRMVQARHRDGVVFDYESPMAAGSSEGQAYVDLIKATRDEFHKQQPYPLQVTTCVAWSPDGIDGRNFPHAQLADASDLLYVMDYDTQSQITEGPCIANANAPYFGMIKGIERYLALEGSIDPKKLVLGVPWYGYQYPCLEGTLPGARYCPIPQVPFRGINCSDAAGHEVPYSHILRMYYEMDEKERNATGGGIRRDEYMDASFLNTRVQNNNDSTTTVFQFWFDDPISLRNKFEWVAKRGIGGVGPFTFDYLDPVMQPEESKAMWSTFDVFRSVVDELRANNINAHTAET